MESKFDFIKVIPILLSVILMGIFLPYIASQNNPIEVYVPTYYVDSNLNVTIDSDSFSNQLILNDTKTDSIFFKNASNSNDSIALGYHLSSVNTVYQTLCIEQNSKITSMAFGAKFVNSEVNISLYNSTMLGNEIVPDSYIESVLLTGINNGELNYTNNSLDCSLLINQTLHNVYFLKFSPLVGATVIAWQNTNYSKTMKYESDVFAVLYDIDYSYNLTLEIIDNNTYTLIDTNTDINSISMVLNNSGIDYNLVLLSNGPYELYSDVSFTITNIDFTTNNSVFNSYSINDNSIELLKDNSYSIVLVNDTSYINDIGLYYNYFNVIHKINIEVNSTNYEITFSEYKYFYL